MASRNNSKRNKLANLKRILTQKAERLRAELQAVDKDLEHVTATMRLLHGANELDNVAKADKAYYKQFDGLTQVEALEKLASDSGKNRFKLGEAARILHQAGLVRNPKNARTILFTAIQRSGKFKRVAPGEYELLPNTNIINNFVIEQKPEKVVHNIFRTATLK